MEEDVRSRRTGLPPAEALLRRVADALDPCPAWVMTRWWDVLGANRAFHSVTGVDVGLEGPFNVLAVSFTTPAVQERYADWPRVAARLVGDLRRNVAQRATDPRGVRLVAELRAASAEFSRLWDDPVAHPEPTSRLSVHHPSGPLEFDLVRLARSAQDDQAVVALLPADRATGRRLAALR